jgi:pimeloyl-ACP methyl ester carboxylesterase
MGTVDQQLVLHVRGTRIAASVRGTGPRTFVWHHGFLSDCASEDELGLSTWTNLPADARLVRYDARGHGDSDRASAPSEMRWAGLGRDLLAVADALAVDRFAAGGASMGCATALHAAVVAPDRITALVLMVPPTAWETRAAQADAYRAAASLFRARPGDAMGLLAAGFEEVSPLGSVIGSDYPEATEIMKRTMGRLDASRLPAAFEGAADSDLPSVDDVARIRCPTLVLGWSGDDGHPLATAHRLAEVMPATELHVASSLADVRHWPALVAQFLASPAVIDS